MGLSCLEKLRIGSLTWHYLFLIKKTCSQQKNVFAKRFFFIYLKKSYKYVQFYLSFFTPFIISVLREKGFISFYNFLNILLTWDTFTDDIDILISIRMKIKEIKYFVKYLSRSSFFGKSGRWDILNNSAINSLGLSWTFI